MAQFRVPWLLEVAAGPGGGRWRGDAMRLWEHHRSHGRPAPKGMGCLTGKKEVGDGCLTMGKKEVGGVVDRRLEVEKKAVVPSRKTHGSGRHWSLDNAVHMINNHHDDVW
jgi:hypothetical protein